ncbi:fibronectin type III-like domain-contianing protein, partial [Acinetobacter baumannii]|nr:fibronectin type III-like domain-contianing protein [Acinetobacter baumannii]
VTNTGASAGTDVPQVYIGRAERTPGRPVRELKGWTRVHLSAGESARVRIALGERAFRTFDTGRGAWITEGGEYVVHLAHDAPATAPSARIRVEGEALSVPTPVAPATTDAEFAALLGRPVPPPGWGSGPLGPNDPMARMRTARSPVARWGFWLLDARLRRAERAGEPEITVLFLLNAPFRM